MDAEAVARVAVVGGGTTGQDAATTAPGARVAEVAALGDRPDRTCGLRTFAPAVGRRVVEVGGGL